MDNFFNFQVQTVTEMTRDLVSEPEIDKDDADMMIRLAAELASVESEAKRNSLQDDLDKQDLIREIIQTRVPYFAEPFYLAEAKKTAKNPKFRFGFHDLIDFIRMRARVNQAQNRTKAYHKVANMEKKVGCGPKTSVAREPKCPICSSIHHIWDCNHLSGLSMEKKIENLKRHGLCYSCLKKEGHLSKDCKETNIYCGKCYREGHYEVMCGLPAYFRQVMAGEASAKSLLEVVEDSRTLASGVSADEANTHST